MEPITFVLNERAITVSGLPPTTTLLDYLRQHLRLTGTKEGCDEGDCGACTVVWLGADARGAPALRAVNACLVLLPMVHGRRLWTVEGLRQGGALHPVQQAVVESLGSQCGYCTPGVVMTLVEACYRDDLSEPWRFDDQLAGTLCRCTGYRPIRDAARQIAGLRPPDALSAALQGAPAPLPPLDYRAGDRFVRPTSLEALWQVMAEEPAHRLVAGATDLGLSVTKGHQRWPCLISLEGLPALKRLDHTGDRWQIGAAVALSDLEDVADRELPALARMLRYFGARQIKSRATVGGNLCNASPIGDLAPILMALGAQVCLWGPGGERRMPLSEFFVGYRQTALQPGEILGAVELLDPPEGARIAAYKVSKRRELDISAVSAGLYLRVDAGGEVVEARFAFGGMAATPKRAAAAEAAVLGRHWGAEAARAAADALAGDFAPISDHRASAWYRAKVARNLMLGFFEETLKEDIPRLPYRHSGTVCAE